MKCLKKIIHHPPICLAFCALLLSVFLSCGLSQDSYATSGTCTASISKTSQSNSTSIYFYRNTQNSADFCNDIRNVPVYIRVKSYDFTFTNSVISYLAFYPLSTSNFPFFRLNLSYGTTSLSSNSPNSSIFPNFYYSDDTISYLTPLPLYIFVQQGAVTFTGSIVFEYTTDLNDWFSNCTPCPEVTPCPPIPENPYDDKLDAIKTAIYACGASLFVIYFFICVYKIIVKDGGSRK